MGDFGTAGPGDWKFTLTIWAFLLFPIVLAALGLPGLLNWVKWWTVVIVLAVTLVGTVWVLTRP